MFVIKFTLHVIVNILIFTLCKKLKKNQTCLDLKKCHICFSTHISHFRALFPLNKLNRLILNWFEMKVWHKCKNEETKRSQREQLFFTARVNKQNQPFNQKEILVDKLQHKKNHWYWHWLADKLEPKHSVGAEFSNCWICKCDKVSTH